MVNNVQSVASRPYDPSILEKMIPVSKTKLYLQANTFTKIPSPTLILKTDCLYIVGLPDFAIRPKFGWNGGNNEPEQGDIFCIMKFFLNYHLKSTSLHCTLHKGNDI